MNKKTKGILAGAAGGALLLGAGGTFALWSDSATVQGGSITAGQLDVEAQPLAWWDVSPAGTILHNGTPGNVTVPRPGGPETLPGADISVPVDGGTFRIVPGDELVGLGQFDFTLQGQNLDAVVSVDFSKAVTDPDGADFHFLPDASLVVTDGDGNVTHLPLGPAGATGQVVNTTVELEGLLTSAQLASLRAGESVVVNAELVIDLNFDLPGAMTPDQRDQLSSVDLGAVGVTVTQVRG